MVNKFSTAKLSRILPLVVIGIILFTGHPLAYWCGMFLLIALCLRKEDRILFSISVTGLTGLALARIMVFELWPQVVHIMNRNITGLIIARHPHAVRLAAVYPAVLVHRLTGQNIHMAFTMLCVLYIAGTIIIIKNILVLARIPNAFIRALIGLALYTGIALQMNGRMISAYFGIALLIYIFTNILVKRVSSPQPVVLGFGVISQVAVAFFLTMVSSGTMLVSFALILVMVVYMAGTKNSPGYSIVAIFLVLITGAVGLYYIAFMTYRNVAFFGGDLYGIIDHGLGRFIDLFIWARVAVVLILPVAVIVLCVVVYFVYRRSPMLLPTFLAVPISFAGAVFGITVGTMALPALIILFLAALPRMTFNQYAVSTAS